MKVWFSVSDDGQRINFTCNDVVPAPKGIVAVELPPGTYARWEETRRLYDLFQQELEWWAGHRALLWTTKKVLSELGKS